MTIAINTSSLSPKQEGYDYYIHEIFFRICRSNPQHKFTFIVDKAPDDEFGWPSNVTIQVFGPSTWHPILWKWWYHSHLPRLLEKIRADLFVSPKGFCSARTRVPQLLVIHDLDFIHHLRLNWRSYKFYSKRYISRCFARASKIITVSEYSKKEIIQYFPFASGKIEKIYNGVHDRFKPLSFERKSEIRARYTEGREYFLYAGSIHSRTNLINLLKGFSIFKKRQQSSMKLVIAGRQDRSSSPFVESLKTYKYREDVILPGYIEEQDLPLLMGGAYAFVYPPVRGGFALPVLESMACGVPVITSLSSAMQEVANDAAVYVDPNDPTSIAAEMMHLYKDEDFRADLSARGINRASEFDWEKAATRFWQVMLESASPNS